VCACLLLQVLARVVPTAPLLLLAVQHPLGWLLALEEQQLLRPGVQLPQQQQQQQPHLHLLQ
jgi:hypothetical protein